MRDFKASQALLDTSLDLSISSIRWDVILLYKNKIFVILEGASNLGRWRCSKEQKRVREISKKQKYRQQACTVLKELMIWKQREGGSVSLSIDSVKPSLLKWAPGIEGRHSFKLINSVTQAAIRASGTACRDHRRKFTKTNVFFRVKGSEQIGSIRFVCSTHLNTVHFIDFEHPRLCPFHSEHTHSYSCSQ